VSLHARHLSEAAVQRKRLALAQEMLELVMKDTDKSATPLVETLQQLSTLLATARRQARGNA
jgi:hypothetical protein